MKMGEDDPPSLEYFDDPYFPVLETGATPSLDEVTEFDHRSLYENGANHDWSEETELYIRALTLDQILGFPDDSLDPLVELQTVETEFSSVNKCEKQSKAFRLKFFTKRALRDVKVTFIDFSKPYLAKISSRDNYKKFLNINESGIPAHRCNLFFID